MKTWTKMLFLLLIGLTLVGCKAKVAQPPTNVVWNEQTVSWDAAEYATSYQIQVDTDIYDVDGTTYTFPEGTYGEFSVSVRSVYKGGTSEFTTPLTVTLYKVLNAPSNLAQSGSEITWDAITDATGYVVKYNDGEYYTTLTHFNINSDTPVQVTVMAVGSETDFINNSPDSDPYLFSVQLATPQNLSYANDILSWDAVDSASGYTLTIGDNEPIELTSTEYDLSHAYVGEYQIQVTAHTATAGYLDSDPATATFTFQALTLSVPDHVMVADGLLTFDPVPYATAYEIYVNGTLYQTITETSFQIPSDVLNIADSYIQVKAISDIQNSSELSTLVYVHTNVITTEAELRQMTVGGSYVLGNDIHLTGEWTPIAFSGVLDGNQHQIDGLSITTDGNYLGYFSVLDGAVIKNLTISGQITLVSETANLQIGGLAGYVTQSVIQDVFVNVDITATSQNGVGDLGGVFGRIESVSTEKVTYTGTIEATNFITGGFAGRISDTTHQTLIHQAKAVATITLVGGEQAYLGGFVGLLASNLAAISESVANVTLSGPVYVGGFVGYLGSGAISDSYSKGSAEATLDGFFQLGGFAGRLEGYNVLVTDCLAMMELVPSATQDTAYVGSFSGVSPSGSYATIYHDCYYDSNLSATPAIGNNGLSNGITGLESTALKDITTFDTNLWNLSGDQPMLVWESE